MNYQVHRRTASVLANLSLHVDLSASAQQALGSLLRKRSLHRSRGEDLLHHGDRGTAFVILSGWAARERILQDGRNCRTALFLPGDVADRTAGMIRSTNYSIVALTDVEIAEIKEAEFERLEREHPCVATALQWEHLKHLCLEREWQVCLRVRSALERVAHFLCETFVRLKAVKLTEENACDFPLSGQTVAELTGMSAVHLSRVTQSLRQSGLVRLGNGRLVISDFAKLRELAAFEEKHLHFGREAPLPSA